MDDAEKSNKRDSFKTFLFTGINKTRFSKFLLNDMRIIILFFRFCTMCNYYYYYN